MAALPSCRLRRCALPGAVSPGARRHTAWHGAVFAWPWGVIAIGAGYDVLLPPGGRLDLFAIPPGLGGLTSMLQGLLLDPMAANHFAAFSDAHELRFLP